MIHINLLPGGRKAKGKGSSLNVGEMFAGVASQAKDPWLLIAIAGVVVGGVLVGAQYLMLGRAQTAVDERQRVAIADSSKYAAILAERGAALAGRDSVVRQFSIIRAIDGERYTWPHMLNELSRALPPLTWLVSIAQTSPVISVVSHDSTPAAPADTTKAKKPVHQKTIDEIANAAMSSVTRLKVHIVGQTVDILAVTHYIRLLEASPFIQDVNLARSDTKPSQTGGGDVTEFSIDLTFETPPPSAIRTVPLTVAVR